MNRFGARYRVARCFQGVTLDAIGDETTSGYSALCQIVLTWAAYEYFLRTLGLNQARSDTLVAEYPADQRIAHIRSLDVDNRLVNFMMPRVNQPHQEALQRYLDGQDFNFTYLASAIRHCFVHGHLTPSANESDPAAVAAVCEEVHSSLMEIMDTEFARGVRRLLAHLEDLAS